MDVILKISTLKCLCQVHPFQKQFRQTGQLLQGALREVGHPVQGFQSAAHPRKRERAADIFCPINIEL
jgi:hypothetical protein